MPNLEEKYRQFLMKVLVGKRPRYMFLGTIGLLVLSIILLAVFPPKTLFFPINQPQYVNVFIEKPIGTDIKETDVTTRLIEQRVFEVLKDPRYNELVNDTLPDGTVQQDTSNFLVSSVIAQVGEGTSDPMSGPSLAATPHKGRVQISFVKYADRRGINSQEVMDRVREAVRGVPGVSVVVDKDASGPPAGKAINIEVKGDDVNGIIAEAERLRQFLIKEHVAGVEELKLDVETGKPEMPVEIDRAKAGRYNVSTYAIGDALRTALYGREVSTYKEGEDDYPVNIRLKDEYRYDPEVLTNMRVTFRDQTNGQIRQVPISALAETKYTSTYSAVKRKDLKRMVQVQSNVLSAVHAGRGGDQSANSDAGLRQGPTLLLRIHWGDQGTAKANGLPQHRVDDRLLCCLHVDRNDVQQQQHASDHHVLRGLQFDRRVPRLDRFPHGIRDHDDHDRYHKSERVWW